MFFTLFFFFIFASINYVKYVSQFKFLNEFFITFSQPTEEKANNLMFFNFLSLLQQTILPYSRLFKHNNKFTIFHLPFSFFLSFSHSLSLSHSPIAQLQVIFFYYYLSRHTPQQTRYTEEQTKNN